MRKRNIAHRTMSIDLMKHKYPIEILTANIYLLNLYDILETQIIDERFAVNYILNPTYQLSLKEETITVEDVFRLQPHLDKELFAVYFAQGPEKSCDILFDDVVEFNK